MALPAATSITTKNPRGMTIDSRAVKTGTTVYKHAILVVNSSGTVQPATNVATTHFVGLASANASATTTVEFFSNVWAKLPIKTGVTAGMEGDTAYAYDDEKVWQTATYGPPIGQFGEILTSYAWVKLGAYPAGNAS